MSSDKIKPSPGDLASVLNDPAPDNAAGVHIQANAHARRNHRGLDSATGWVSLDTAGSHVYLNEVPASRAATHIVWSRCRLRSRLLITRVETPQNAMRVVLG